MTPSPTSSGFLSAILIVVSGYVFLSNFTLIKGINSRSNGQRLYLQCITYGLSFALIGFIFRRIFHSFLHFGKSPDFTFGIYDIGVTSLNTSLISLLALQLPITISNGIGGKLDLNIERILAFKFRPRRHRPFVAQEYQKTLNHIERLIYKIINISLLYTRIFWIILQLRCHEYAKWVGFKSLNNNQIDIMTWENLALEDGNIFILCVENKKIFIGFPTTMPDPTHTPDEQTIRFFPIMSGFLCDDFHSLHITEDLIKNIEIESDISENSAPYGIDSQLVLRISKITYIREYDFMEFLDTIDSNSTCACKREIYLAKSENLDSANSNLN